MKNNCTSIIAIAFENNSILPTHILNMFLYEATSSSTLTETKNHLSQLLIYDWFGKIKSGYLKMFVILETHESISHEHNFWRDKYSQRLLKINELKKKRERPSTLKSRISLGKWRRFYSWNGNPTREKNLVPVAHLNHPLGTQTWYPSRILTIHSAPSFSPRKGSHTIVSA